MVIKISEKPLLIKCSIFYRFFTKMLIGFINNFFVSLVAAQFGEGPTLPITRVDRTHMGAYLCIASNGVPPSVSKRITLIVHCKYSTHTHTFNSFSFIMQHSFTNKAFTEYRERKDIVFFLYYLYSHSGLWL